MARLTKKEKRKLYSMAIGIALVFILLVLFIPMIPYTAAIEPETAGSLEKFVAWFAKIKDWFGGGNYVLVLFSLLGIYGLAKLR